MNRVLLKGICNEFLKTIKTSYIDISERRHNTQEVYDPDTNYPYIPEELQDPFKFELSNFIFHFNYSTAFYELSNEDKIVAYKDCIIKLNEYISTVKQFWFIEEDEYGYYIAKKNEKEELIEALKDCIEYCEEEIEILSSKKEKGIKGDIVEDKTKPSLLWENKTELVEFIQALYLSKAIKKDGKEVQQKELIEIFSNLFNCDLKTFNTLLSQGINNKSKTLFTTKLAKLIEDYIKSKEK